MKTIEDLKVEKTAFRREKDEAGNTIRVPYTKLVARTPEVVNPGIRFLYFIVDLVFFYIIQIILGIILGVILAATHNLDLLYDPSFVQTTNLLLGYGGYFLYYFIFDTFTGGSLAKLAFGYTVIDQHAQRISVGKGALRTICRYVPFEAFSCFGERGWHDSWSKTYVVKRTEKQELLKLLGNLNDHNDILD